MNDKPIQMSSLLQLNVPAGADTARAGRDMQLTGEAPGTASFAEQLDAATAQIHPPAGEGPANSADTRKVTTLVAVTELADDRVNAKAGQSETPVISVDRARSDRPWQNHMVAEPGQVDGDEAAVGAVDDSVAGRPVRQAADADTAVLPGDVLYIQAERQEVDAALTGVPIPQDSLAESSGTRLQKSVQTLQISQADSKGQAQMQVQSLVLAEAGSTAPTGGDNEVHGVPAATPLMQSIAASRSMETTAHFDGMRRAASIARESNTQVQSLPADVQSGAVNDLVQMKSPYLSAEIPLTATPERSDTSASVWVMARSRQLNQVLAAQSAPSQSGLKASAAGTDPASSPIGVRAGDVAGSLMTGNPLQHRSAAIPANGLAPLSVAESALDSSPVLAGMTGDRQTIASGGLSGMRGHLADEAVTNDTISLVETPDNMFHAQVSGTITAPQPLRTDAAVPVALNAPHTVFMQSPDAGESLGSNVKWMVDDGVQNAVINVSPSGMGPIKVTLDMTKDHMNISIVASQGTTREALDAMLPRLREQLGAQGFDSVSVNVSDGNTDSTRGNAQQQFGQARGDAGHSDQPGMSDRNDQRHGFNGGVGAAGTGNAAEPASDAGNRDATVGQTSQRTLYDAYV